MLPMWETFISNKERHWELEKGNDILFWLDKENFPFSAEVISQEQKNQVFMEAFCRFVKS